MQDSGDEGEQRRVAAEAQLLLDCVADLVQHKGLKATQVQINDKSYDGCSSPV